LSRSLCLFPSVSFLLFLSLCHFPSVSSLSLFLSFSPPNLSPSIFGFLSLPSVSVTQSLSPLSLSLWLYTTVFSSVSVHYLCLSTLSLAPCCLFLSVPFSPDSPPMSLFCLFFTYFRLSLLFYFSHLSVLF
jgi:hypothetical protein